ncbi:MAG: hypothetical protein BVN35_09525 [Proteobacteria bacterium ST_bin11]|jgi:hypothetical protein|nr:MAG: hypothetical protein BVN35_09525 [Proteobacteria bacterium ST_bin11]
MKQNPLMQSVAVAEINAQLLCQEYANAVHRLHIAKKDVCFYADQASRAHSQYLNAVRLKGRSYLDLMNSGISHRAYLRFLRSTEPCLNF